MLDTTPPPVPLLLRVWAWLTAACALPLAVLGAEVTTKKAGMVDRQGFRAPWHLFTTDQPLSLGYLIEHGHRLFGFVVGNCCIVLALGMLIFARGWRRLLGVIALAAVSGQGILGIYRVDLDVKMGPGLALLHGCLAQLVFAVLVCVAVLSSRTWSRPAVTSRGLRIGGLVLCVVVYVQIVFGAFFRHLTDPIAQRGHVIFAFVVMGVALWMHGKMHRESTNVAATRVGYFLALLLLFQPILGVEAWVRLAERRHEAAATGTILEVMPRDATLDGFRSGHHVLGTLIFTTTAALAALLCRPSLAPVPQQESHPLLAVNPVAPTAIHNLPLHHLKGSA